ncbi:MAG: trypsin-like peptidase domain-containing protein [Chloroflexi bacterium]|nr:trypsin-like peptidase domain-containing protein [Chloroflexota bacterium]MCY3697933.1 trypsin-like peptidase domain-containing protein [Chloroflexota bacterium]MXX30695.1 PDZ domain-containing protein [Chloroflexota bacterium]MXX81013.1 PDZ domain-containing protein [Chloroflexota bacterium]MYD17103.1 PDZ domain-containing protein [Chloroflexota bacterium]
MRHTFTISVLSALIGGLCGALIVLFVSDDSAGDVLEPEIAAAVREAVSDAVEQATSQSDAQIAERIVDSMAERERLIGEIFAQVVRSVVVIDAEGPERVNDEGVTVVPAALATGFVLDDMGHVVTAAHVLEGMTSFTVIFHGEQRLPALRVGDDRPFSDVAVLRVEAGNEPLEPIVPTFGASDSVAAGETVIAIGNTLLGREIALTVGVVSNPDTTFFRGRYEQEDLIQTDAALNHGNSGGILVDLDGSIVGMTAVIARETVDGGFVDGVGFAVQIDAVLKVARGIAEDGYYPRPSFGVVQERLLTPIAAVQLDLAVSEGAFLIEIERSGAFARAGIRPGDVLLGMNGVPINAETPYLNALAQLEPGVPVLVHIHRAGEEYRLSIAPDLRAP